MQVGVVNHSGPMRSLLNPIDSLPLLKAQNKVEGGFNRILLIKLGGGVQPCLEPLTEVFLFPHGECQNPKLSEGSLRFGGMPPLDHGA